MTFLWHDYETFGTHPGLDRASQFAAIRTDESLRPVGEPVTWYCKPQRDNLPNPFACLVTGITPQEADRKGVVETEFAQRIHAEMMEPNTCSVGYNSLNFDDEFSRNLFYRNFMDPYEREYKNGNSRFDLIDLVRMYYALRPGGIQWPEREPGIPSFKLEDLTAANGIEHAGAHDALVDVNATIELARLLRQQQPRLFDWALTLRDQTEVRRLVDPNNPKPVLHTSSRIPASRGCTTLVLPICFVPDRPKSIVVIDLMSDPEPLLALDADEISDRVFTPGSEMPEGIERIPLKAIHSNKLPMIAPPAVLKGVDTQRIGLDPAVCEKHAEILLEHLAEIRPKIMTVFQRTNYEPGTDPDAMIYSGGFFSGKDRGLMQKVLQTPPDELGQLDLPFEDPRLAIMLFRYQARNYPETLSMDEAEQFEQDRLQRLDSEDERGRLGFAGFNQQMAEARQLAADDGDKNRVLDELEHWVLNLKGD